MNTQAPGVSLDADARPSENSGSPDTPLSRMDFVPRNRLSALARLGLLTLGDLIIHYPRRHEDRRRFDRFPDAEMDRPVCLLGIVTKTSLKRLGGWRRMFEITLEDEASGVLGHPVTCRWFNMPYIQRMFATGQRVVIFGRPKRKGRQVVIDHPEFERVEEGDESSIHMDRIAPVHPAGDGVPTRLLRQLIYVALRTADLSRIPSLLGCSISQALHAIHFPETFEDLQLARHVLVREEFFRIQLVMRARRARYRAASREPRVASGKLIRRMVERLPFQLTASQQEAIGTICRDLAEPCPMNRLLQGDVGSGKTLVALAAMLQVVEAGWQCALMAPTQILAEQHFLTFKSLLEPLGLVVSLRTADKKESNAPLPLFADQALFETASEGAGVPGPPHIVVGTHALLYESTPFQRLGLIIIDEQHKFGVLQRTRLVERAANPGAPSAPPDLLVMTATPIPRTLTQTFYGDLDVSVIRDKPANRGEIQTVARRSTLLPEVVDFLKVQLEKGRQAYIVYPLVEESAKITAKAASAEFEKWRQLLSPRPVALLHGRVSPEDKEAIMMQFREGRIAALVATTVIEVGVDVPNATVMVIENAERFGLAQLHQLRGRIGRGTRKSFCILLHDTTTDDEARSKLEILEKTCDGFAIAEADLKLRGAGDLVGTAQTGLPPLRLGDLVSDAPLMDDVCSLAERIFTEDPFLEDPRHEALRGYVDSMSQKLEIAHR